MKEPAANAAGSFKSRTVAGSLVQYFTFLCDVPLEGPRSGFSFFAERKLGKYVENNIRIFCPLLS